MRWKVITITAGCPALHKTKKLIMKILLPIDDSVCSQTAAQALASQIRGKGNDVEVHVLHVIQWPKIFSETFLPGHDREFGEKLNHFLATRRQQARSLTDCMVQFLRQAGLQAVGLVREADPKQAILEYASEWAPDLIVVGSHGRRGLERIALGSVSEAVMRHAHCSVQIIRQAPIA
jgi:nucleotide-binding universal stress UspA family protein